MNDEVAQNPIQNQRILEENNEVLFHTATTSPLKPEQFTIKFDKKGIDLYIIGLNSDITSGTFDKVEAALNLQKKSDNGEDVVEEQTQEMMGNAVSTYHILNSIIVLFFLI